MSGPDPLLAEQLPHEGIFRSVHRGGKGLVMLYSLIGLCLAFLLVLWTRVAGGGRHRPSVQEPVVMAWQGLQQVGTLQSLRASVLSFMLPTMTFSAQPCSWQLLRTHAAKTECIHKEEMRNPKCFDCPDNPRGSASMYSVVKSAKNYELRLYNSFIVATTPYERRDEGIAALRSYFEGGNEQEIRLPSTPPLMLRMKELPAGGFEKTCSLSLDLDKSLAANLPKPTRAGVKLDVMGGGLLAASSFPGIATPGVVTKLVRVLRQELKMEKLEVLDEDEFYLVTYPDINEVWIKIGLPKIQGSGA